MSHSPATSPRKGLGNLAVQTFPNVIYIIMAGGTAFRVPGAAAGCLSDNALANKITDVFEPPRVTLCLQMFAASDLARH